MPESMSESPSVLRLEALCVRMGRGLQAVEAVRGLSLDLQPGETLCLVGASGAGKSAIGLAILGLQGHAGGAITGGKVLFRAGRGAAPVDLVPLDRAALRRVRGAGIGMIFQDPTGALNPVLSVGAQIAEALRAHGRRDGRTVRTRALELLERVHLPGGAAMLGRYAHELSGGQRQRAMIAVALAAEPSVLIADEPTTALDPETEAGILALLKRLQDELGLALLLITHDMGVVARVADRVAVLQAGALVEEGTAARVLAAPRHPETRRLLGTLAPDAAASAPRPGLAPVLELRNLTLHHAGRRAARTAHPAVENVSLSLSAGRTLALVGPSGAGKTSLGRAVLRLLPSSGGRILLEGRDITHARGAELHAARARMQMIFQDPGGSLDPRLTLAAQVAEPLRNFAVVPRRAEAAEVARLFDLVQLPRALMRRYPHELSGGQRQRAAIARAIAPRPGLIVADEAISALDRALKAEIVALLRGLQDELGLALLFISHDMEAVARIAHDIAVMESGRIVEAGPAEAILRAPTHARTRALLAARRAEDQFGLAPGGPHPS